MKNNFLAHAFILLTSPRIRSQSGFAGVSIHEKIFSNRLRKIRTCDFRESILQTLAHFRRKRFADNLEPF